jgi:hypothetical protein
VEYFLSDYSNNILNVFVFFGDAGVTYLKRVVVMVAATKGNIFIPV